MSKRKKHNPEFKAKVALEALKGEHTVSKLAIRLARKFSIPSFITLSFIEREERVRENHI